MSFLSLPTELRYEIYALIAIPTSTPHASYNGLYLSCHQILSEMDKECTKRLLAHIFPLSLSLLRTPTSFREIQHLHMSLDHTIYRVSPAPKDILELAKLHFKRITLTSHIGPNRVVSEIYTTDLLRFIGQDIISEEANVGKFAVKMPRANEELAIWWVESGRQWSRMGKGGYGFGWVLGREEVWGVWRRGRDWEGERDEGRVGRGLMGLEMESGEEEDEKTMGRAGEYR